MTEDDARSWISANFDVSRGTLLRRFGEMVIAESTRQNLVSAASLDQLWARHIVDSAQLIALADEGEAWVDVGTGAGFPGLIVGILTDRPVVLIEPRRKRAAFLADAVVGLDLADRVTVVCARAEKHHGAAHVISARAVAPLADIFTAAAHLSTAKTCWILPKGSRAHEEVAAAKQTWHGVFHVEQSITDPQSLIITARGVSRQ